MTRIQMPQLGLTMTEGNIQRWLKSAGDAVQKGEPLFEVETDKVVMDVESPADGVLLEILAGENQTIPVGGDVAVLGLAEEA